MLSTRASELGSAVCQGDSAQRCAVVQPGTVTGPFTYMWTGPGITDPTLPCQWVGAGFAPGTYTYTVVATGDNGCSSGPAIRTLVVCPQPVCEITGNLDIRVGDSAYWCAAAGMATYDWSGPGLTDPSAECQWVGIGALEGVYTYQVIITD